METDTDNSLEIFILCHNRVDDTRHAINSVLNQTNHRYTLKVSDNSSSDEVERMVRQEFPDVTYVRRVPMLPALMHFNQCISEAKSDYFCLFHDDDIMHEDYVSEMQKCIRQFPDAAAWGCNAEIENQGVKRNQVSFRSYKKYEMLRSARKLAEKYFSRHQSGFAPFPGYVYNRKRMGDILIPPDGGKYADVTWLLKIAQRGSVVWITRPLMTYRFHGTNDGSIESVRDRLRFLGFIKQNLPIFGNGILEDYRCSFVYKRFVRTDARTSQSRKRIAKRFLSAYSIKRYSRMGTYKAIFNRQLTKWMAPK